ncbi:MAG: pirin family protein [Nitrospinae bacterium]|nr:pirin family protein [Nitrospinota bacterium]
MSESDRPVVKVVRGKAVTEGAGVRLTRMFPNPQLDMLDPFLLLDEFKSDKSGDYIAGFPSHPHRGFETVTYMLAGAMRHEDHTGATGELLPGGAQWMTAGRGVIHSEMPLQRGGLLWGFQLWVNLPAARKMDPPRYQDIAPERIPSVTLEGGAVARVIAGEAGGARGPVEGIVTDPLYLDVTLAEGTSFIQRIPAGHTAFALVYEGAARFGATALARGELAVFGPGDVVRGAAESGGGRLILLAAAPLNEPVARYGPFVMNTVDEIEKAFDDYRAGRLDAA